MKFISFAPIARVAGSLFVAALLASACVDSAGLDAGGGGGEGSGGTGGSNNKKIIPGTGGGTMCGPVCDIFCEFGNVADDNGCPTCSCNPGPVCDAIACANNCPGGFVKDATGCPTCQCQPIDCPAIACIAIACPNSNQVDRNGCPTCACNPDPVCDCKNAPIPNVACANGGTPPLTCERSSAGQCFWKVGACPMCAAVSCDLFCPFGNAKDANGCELCKCNPEPKECQPTECGVQTLIAIAPPVMCEDGTFPGRQCLRNADGQCSWQFTSCPVACRDLPDLKTCETVAHCQWLAPGCDGVKLPAAGCFPRAEVGCQSDANCHNGRTCQKRSVDPCGGRANAVCLACAQIITVCL